MLVVDRRTTQALAHPTRVRILRFLKDAEVASPNTMATEFRVSLGSVSYHVRRLHKLGFLKLVKQVPRRGATEHFYRLAPGIGAEERVALASRDLFAHHDDAPAVSRALLDARAIAALRPSVDALFSRMRTLEAETVRRTAVAREASAFTVDVLFLVEDSDAASA